MITRNERLTGRWRFRYASRFFGPPLVVLQVEGRGISHGTDGRDCHADLYTFWRDATPADVMPSGEGERS